MLVGEVGSGITITDAAVVAAAAAVAIILNRQLGKATANMVDARKQEATASRQMIEEVRRDRELNWQPFLVTAERQRVVRPASPEPDITLVKNIGRGPALNCVVVSNPELS